LGLREDKDNTVERRMNLLEKEKKYYMQKYGGVRRLEKNNDIPTSIPKKIALLYQTKLDIEFEKT
jgi:hypothetical protein